MARVLIVDDERSLRVSLGEFAGKDGHEVSLAGDAAEALRLLDEMSFDVVVSDIILPRKTGVVLLADIREAHPNVQVIMITGEPEVDTAAEAVRRGAFDYLSKPVTRKEISKVVAAAAAKKLLLDRNRQLEEENRQYRENLEEKVKFQTQSLQESAERYRSLFDDSAVAMFECDFSSVKKKLDEIHDQGILDFSSFLRLHSDEARDIIKAANITTANQAAALLQGAPNRDALRGPICAIMAPEAADGFLDTIVSLYEEPKLIETESILQTRDGRHLEVLVRLGLPLSNSSLWDVVNISLIDITQRRLAVERVQRTLEGTVGALGTATEVRDPYTAGHQKRVTELAIAIGVELDLDQNRMYGLRLSGLLHDIGKLGIPAEILSKPTALTKIEYALIKAHPDIAFDILSHVEFENDIPSIVRQHHERMDGSGYPDGLQGDEILLEARILSVADTVEAMASHRPYRSAPGLEAALDEIKSGAGTIYDPAVVEACLTVFEARGFSFTKAPV